MQTMFLGIKKAPMQQGGEGNDNKKNQ